MRYLVVFLLILLSSCSKEKAPAENIVEYNLSVPETLDERFSYAFGYLLSSSASVEFGEEVDFAYVARGAMDYAEGRQMMSASEMNQAFIEFQQQRAVTMQAELEEAARSNLQAANDFLSANRLRSGVNETESGLQYEVLREGSGKSAESASDVEVDYQLTLLDGTIADSSYERGRSSRFSLSALIPGFAEGVSLMREGSTYRFWIPPDLGYGDITTGTIGPNSLLIFDVHLISILD